MFNNDLKATHYLYNVSRILGIVEASICASVTLCNCVKMVQARITKPRQIQLMKLLGFDLNMA